MSSTPRATHRSSRNKEIHASSKWYVIQVDPGAELEFARLVQGQFQTAGLAQPLVIPSPQAKRSRRHAHIPYRGLVFVCAKDLEESELEDKGIIDNLEESDFCRGFVYEPETILIEFEGLQADDGSGSVNEAITKINRLSKKLHFSGQAAPLLSEAKSYLPGDRGRSVIDQFYLDTEGVGYPDQSDFIEVKMYYSQHHRELITEVSGIVDIVGGSKPLAKRGAVLKPAEMTLLTIKGSVVERFAKHRYELYVIQTKSQGEPAVMESLNAHRASDEEALFKGENVNLFINHVRFVAPDDDTLGIVKKKLTTYLYISVHLDTTSWHLIRDISKVSGFVGGKTIEEVRPLTARESNLLFGNTKKRTEREYVPVLQANYEVGEMVKITDGPFAMYIGLVQEVNASQERIKVQIEHKAGATGGQSRSRFAISRSIVTDVMFSQVEKLD
jgi:transcription termination/antitermination protein NusG